MQKFRKFWVSGFELTYRISKFAIHLRELAIQKKLKNKQNCNKKGL